jgi:putative tryptophan/tyrosine transport system substrate-binding protein
LSGLLGGLKPIFSVWPRGMPKVINCIGPDYLQMNQRAPLYVNQIVKGTNPADLPVELPTRISLLVNLKSAKTLGAEVPLSLLVRADELIE